MQINLELIDNQATCFLQFLRAKSEDLQHLVNESASTLDVSTFYNGRERGLMIRVSDSLTESKYIVVGECRSSDHMFLDTWTAPRSMNPPTVTDWPESAYENRKTFEPYDFRTVYEAVTDEIYRYFQARW